MYTRAQKESSSTSPTSSIHKKSNNSESSHSFSVQRQPEINSSQEKERPRYSRNAADLLAANVMRSMAARQQGEEAQGHKGQEELGAASVAQVVMPKPELPIAPVASVFQPSREMGKQMQCSACEQAIEDGKDSDEMSSGAGIQTKLTVGAVGDKYEQEADRVAAQVMRMSIPPDHSPQVQRFGEEDNPVQRWSLAQSITPVVHRRVDEQVQMRELVQRAFQAGGNEASGDLESRLNASKGGGSALAPEVRAFMEPRFGADFSSVRVHTGNDAVQMNRELGAQAFAHGSDVYFGAGKEPGNNELTAHELTHVVQQTGGVQTQFLPNQLTVQQKCSNCEGDQVKLKESPEAVIGREAAPVDLAITSTSTSTIQRRACSVTGSFSSIPSGTLSATLSGTKLGAAFNMIGNFTPSIPCNCSGGEYRQYVRGTFTRNGSNVTHYLCGTTLNPTTFQEDCGIFGGTVYKYGYRSIPFDNSKFINPDQATGCTFQGFDNPGITGSSGDTLAVNLDFKGELIDIWNGNNVLASSAWSVVGTATVP